MNSQQLLARRSRNMNAGTAVFALVGVLLLGFRDQILTLVFGASRLAIDEGQYDWAGRQIFAMGLVFAAMAFFLVLLRYLRGELTLNLGPFKAEMRTGTDDSSIETPRLAALEDQINRIETAISAQGVSAPMSAVENFEAILLDRVAKEIPAKLAEQLNANTLQ